MKKKPKPSALKRRAGRGLDARLEGRTRDVPHPGRPRRELAARADVVIGAVKFPRVAGTNGSWPTHDQAPRRPLILYLYDDLNDLDDPPAVFGQYPRGLIGKLMPWLRCTRREILHVCSGSLPRGEGIRVDVRAAARPDVVADGRALPFGDGTAAAVMIDPPYTEHYARDLYGTDYPRPSHLLREAARVVQPGGRIAIVHYITPNPPAATRLVKVFGLSTSFGFPMRAVTLYERDQVGLPGVP